MKDLLNCMVTATIRLAFCLFLLGHVLGETQCLAEGPAATTLTAPTTEIVFPASTKSSPGRTTLLPI